MALNKYVKTRINKSLKDFGMIIEIVFSYFADRNKIFL